MDRTFKVTMNVSVDTRPPSSQGFNPLQQALQEMYPHTPAIYFCRLGNNDKWSPYNTLFYLIYIQVTSLKTSSYNKWEYNVKNCFFLLFILW